MRETGQTESMSIEPDDARCDDDTHTWVASSEDLETIDHTFPRFGIEDLVKAVEKHDRAAILRKEARQARAVGVDTVDVLDVSNQVVHEIGRVLHDIVAELDQKRQWRVL